MDGISHATEGQLADMPPVLIVEPHQTMLEMLYWTLALAGYRVQVCKDRDATLLWGEQITPAENPALLLLDVSLLSTAEITDFLARLRTRWREVGRTLPPIIVLTTSPQVRDALASSETILLKPFRSHDLLALIQGLVPEALVSPLEQLSRQSLLANCHSERSEESA